MNQRVLGLQTRGRRALVGRRGLALLAFGFIAALHADTPAGSIDDFIASEMPASGVPGLAYAVVTDGKITTVEARGVAMRGGDKPVTPDTPFNVGSVSKSFTALAVMQLVEAGKVGLDTAVSRYLPAFSGQSAGAVTIRQLLSHTSGFSTFQGNNAPNDDTQSEDKLARLVEQQAGVTPAYPPGAQWEYSNLNYEILGRLIEVVSGETFQSYIATHIMAPVGMTHSFVADGKIHEAMASGHRPWFGSKRPLAVNHTDLGTAPQGGVIASAGDLARYMLMMLNGRDDDVLSAEGKAAMMRPASDASPFYGFGWFVDTRKGTVFHTGNSVGYESILTMVPAQKKGVVVLVNAGGGLGFGGTGPLRLGITARALDLDYDVEGTGLSLKILAISLVLTPVMFLFSMVWAWRHRHALRAKTESLSGRFSLWFPLLTTLGTGWVVFSLMPRLVGASFSTLNLFGPDLGLTLIAIPVTGVLWAVFRLGVAYSGKAVPYGPRTGKTSG